MKNICSDLKKQYWEMDDLLTGPGKGKWGLQTPFFNWTIFDELAHIALFDHESILAIENPVFFKERARIILKKIKTGDSWPRWTHQMLGLKMPVELLSYWRQTRSHLIKKLENMNPHDRLHWYGPTMSTRSFATARLMETWAHTQDIFDTLNIKRKANARLYHIAHIGVTTFNWSFKLRCLPPPSVKPRFELTGPSGEKWSWGEIDAPERVWGCADEFCLLVTQRRNVADTRLKWRGENVEKWISIAQAFAGEPQNHPPPLSSIISSTP